jgi:general secretion pathway protein K
MKLTQASLRLRSQYGAALITAMLLAALITILAASWLSRFDSQLRIVDMARTGTQARWLMRSATDWAAMILKETPPRVTHLGQNWALVIAPIRINDMAGTQEAFFSGRMQDAQARFNLYNLYLAYAAQSNGQPLNKKPFIWATNLMIQAGLSSAQADAWLAAIKKYTPSSSTRQEQQRQWEDTLPVALALDSIVKDRLANVFVWLANGNTLKVNINTAELTVLSAHPSIGESTAKRIIDTRTKAYVQDVQNTANSLGISSDVANDFDISSNYFMATGRLTMGRADLMTRSLLQRSPSQVWWTKPL